MAEPTRYNPPLRARLCLSGEGDRCASPFETPGRRGDAPLDTPRAESAFRYATGRRSASSPGGLPEPAAAGSLTRTTSKLRAGPRTFDLHAREGDTPVDALLADRARAAPSPHLPRSAACWTRTVRDLDIRYGSVGRQEPEGLVGQNGLPDHRRVGPSIGLCSRVDTRAIGLRTFPARPLDRARPLLP